MTEKNSFPKVLVVDDLPSNLQIVVNVLNGLDIDLFYATNGVDAIETAVREVPDLLLLDIMMPGMDGYEVCRSLRQNPKTSDIPIVFITARNDEEGIIQGFESGGNDYVTKPFNPLELKARVLTQLELRAATKSLKALNAEMNKEIGRLRKTIQDFEDELVKFRERLVNYVGSKKKII